MGNIFSYLSELFCSRFTIFELAKRDFKTKYLGSYLGIVWAFVQPVIYIFLMWFIFQFGFKSHSIQNVPYVLWVMPGIAIWSFFSESLLNATNAIIENSYLVKKIAFKAGMLLIMKIFSSLFVHLIFLAVMLILFMVCGHFSIYFLQIFYYLFGLLFFVISLAFITSAAIVFVRDVGPFLLIILNFGFWFTPIFWDIHMIPPKLQHLMKLNPIYYLVEGYRNSFVDHVGFWEHPFWMLYFWFFNICLFIFGAYLFNKLRPHFADVL